jgi:outer membrane lipoprotein-sorting protein
VRTKHWARKAATLGLILLTIPFLYFANPSGAEQMNASAPGIVRAQVMQSDYNDGAPFIAKLIAGAKAVSTYTSDYAMVVHKSSGIVKENGVVSFKKPHLLRVEVKGGAKKGSLAVFEADGKIHGHMGGALKMFGGAVSPESSFAKTINGFPMSGTDFYSLFNYLQVNMLDKGDHSRVTKGPVETSYTKQPTMIVDMFSKGGDQPLLTKRIFVDPGTNLPVYWEDYTDGKLYCESFWSNTRTGVDLSDSLFKI